VQEFMLKTQPSAFPNRRSRGSLALNRITFRDWASSGLSTQSPICPPGRAAPGSPRPSARTRYATRHRCGGVDDALIRPDSGHATRRSLEICSRLALANARQRYDDVIGDLPS
jgi:hypothetical protein